MSVPLPKYWRSPDQEPKSRASSGHVENKFQASLGHVENKFGKVLKLVLTWSVTAAVAGFLIVLQAVLETYGRRCWRG